VTNAHASRSEDLDRISIALDAAVDALKPFIADPPKPSMKVGRNPVTDADLAVDELLADLLPRGDEGWLSEESIDNADRLRRSRVWVVDPIDGTREFVDGVPEWCVSIGLIENGRPVAGGVANPGSGERIIGSAETGVGYTGDREPSRASRLADALILASRSEVRRGEWDRFASYPFAVLPMGSIAFKLALVAAGRADATWSLVPKHEWDIAAGAALVAASGGWIAGRDGFALSWNRPNPLIGGLIATSAAIADETAQLLGVEARGRFGDSGSPGA
jgi:myo-inositol-1(or 4)-monophosphatase